MFSVETFSASVERCLVAQIEGGGCVLLIGCFLCFLAICLWFIPAGTLLKVQTFTGTEQDRPTSYA